MTNSDFKKQLSRLMSAKVKYFQLLEIAENEYLERFGFIPSDVDDDFWIDTFHTSESNEFDFKELLSNAEWLSQSCR